MFKNLDSLLTELHDLDIRGCICLNLWDRHPDWSDEGSYGIGKPNQDALFPYEYTVWLQRLSKFLTAAKFEHIVDSTYGTPVEYSNPATFNTLTEYLWHHRTQVNEQQSKILSELIVDAHHYRLSEKVKTVFDNDHSFTILTAQSLHYHLSAQNIDIKNWLVLGNTWQQCTHNRPNGLFALLDTFPHLNFYGTDSTFWTRYKRTTAKEDFINDPMMEWKQASTSIFQAVKSKDRTFELPPVKYELDQNTGQWEMIETNV